MALTRHRLSRAFAAALLLGVVQAQDECSACESQIADLQTTWTNATTVAEILASLETDCAAKYPRQPGKTSLCDDVASVFVQIPPGLFEGLETLAWPIPLGVCATIGKCVVPCCEEGAGPEQLHLSLAGFGDTSRMAVAWVDLDGQGSAVEYRALSNASDVSGGDPGPTQTATGTVLASTTEHPLPPWAAGWVGAIHQAVMTALTPGTRYEYRVSDGSGADALWSPWTSFKTLPPPSAFADPSFTLKFAVIGDMDYAEKSDATVANLIALVDAGELDVVVHSGDISYADGFMPHWDTFLNKVQPIASRVPYMVTPGNHEFWYNFSQYKHRFCMPNTAPNDAAGTTRGSGDNMYYEWGVAGLAHFVAADSETAVDTANFGTPQVTWMDGVLSDADQDRDNTPWSLVHFHRPLYCSNDGECNSPDGMARVLRQQAEGVFEQRGVDLVFEGHIHSYERTYPMANWTATQLDYTHPTAPVYVVQGSSGNRENNPGFPADPPSWSAARSSNIGFGLLEASAKSLNFKFFTADAANGPQLTDEFTITK